MKRRRMHICLLLSVLLGLLFLCACKEKQEVPQLLESVVGQSMYRTVERGNIGKTISYLGLIVPQEYCHFYEKGVTIQQIYCEPGDYVEEGTLLCCIDEEETKKQLKAKKTELENYKQREALRTDIHTYQIQYLEVLKTYYPSGSQWQKQNQKNIELEQEDLKYDQLLAEYMVESLEREIKELETLLKKGRLYAKHSGYVSFVCDLSSGKSVSPYENVIIIADYDNCHLEADELTTDESLKYYSGMYTYLDGKKEELETIPYTDRELVYIKNKGKHVPLRFTTKSGNMGSAGESVIITLVKDGLEDVLIIGQDSVFTDEEGSYVLVQTNPSEVEKRYVSLGSGDGYYIQVLEGLSEGEKVQYRLTETVVTNYEEITVERMGYTESVNSTSVKQLELSSDFYVPPCAGTIEEVYVSIGDTVEEGDPLYTISNTDGRGAIADLEKQIYQLELSHKQNLDTWDKEIWNLNQVRGQIPYIISKAETERDLVNLEYEQNLQALEDQLTEAKKTYNQGSKTVIYAKNSGVVRSMKAKKGIRVTQYSDALMQIAVLSENEIWVFFPKISPGCKKAIDVTVGKSVSLYGKETAYEGYSVDGLKSGKVYYFTENDKVYCTTCRTKAATGILLTVKVDTEKLYDEDTPVKGTMESISLKKEIVIPGDCVYAEPTLEGHLDYVWKLVDGTLVKQYIRIGTEYGIGTSKDTVVLAGLEEGDVLARQILREE